MSILDHNQHYETTKEASHDQDFGKCFWFCGSMRLHKNKKDRIVVNDEIVQEQKVDQLQNEPENDQYGTYFKLNGSFAESDLSNSDEDQTQIHQNGYSEEDNDGMWFGLSGRQRRAESMENLLVGVEENGKKDFDNELEDIDAQFKAIEQLVLESFDQIDFGQPSPETNKPSKNKDEFGKFNTESLYREKNLQKRKEIKVNAKDPKPEMPGDVFYVQSNNPSQSQKKNSNVKVVSEESIVVKVVEDDHAMNATTFDDIDFESLDPTNIMSEPHNVDQEKIEPIKLKDQSSKNPENTKKEEAPRVLLKRQMQISSVSSTSVGTEQENGKENNEDYNTSEDKERKRNNFKRGTSFRRSIVIEDEVGTTAKRKQSTGGTCVSVAFMAIKTSVQDEPEKKSTNQQLKGILNFLENMVLDEESLSLYYDAVRTLHTMYWDFKDNKADGKSGKSLSTVLNFLVVHEWPKVMLSCIKKLKASYPHVFLEEKDAETTIYYSGHLPSLLRMNRTTPEFAVSVIFDGLLKAAVNFTDVHEASRQACCEDNLLSYLLEDIMPQLHNIKWGKTTAREMFLKSICDLLYNCAQSYSNAAYLLDHNCVDILTTMRDQTFHVVDARKVNMAMLLSLSYLIDDNNYDIIVPSEEFVIRLLQFLDGSLEHSEHTYHDFYAAELVGCLARLAGHSAVKIMITRNSGQEILHKLLKYAYDDEERIAACHALWNLTFCNEAKDILRGMSKLMNHLRELMSSSNDILQRAASGIIWECEEKYDLQGTRKTHSKNSPQHVMISYEFETQPLVIGMRDELNRQGYQVWMKCEDDDRSLLDSMTRGVELASVVIVALTRKYKLSPYAFAEADYAQKLRKIIVPVIVDVDFVPDGWLKDIIETERTFDFSRRSMFGGSLDALVDHIRSLVSPDALQMSSLNTECPNNQNSEVLSWANSDVIYWLQQNQLIKSVSNVGRLNKLTGLHLLMFFDLKKESPDYYYSVLDSHLGFKDVLDTLEFTYAMDRLLGRERLI